MPLTDEIVESLEPNDRVYKKYDSLGLLIEIHPRGSKYWRFRYFFNNKPNQISVGVYPRVKIEAARAARDVMLSQLESGQDPSQIRKANKLLEPKVKKKTMTLEQAINSPVTDLEIEICLGCVESFAEHCGDTVNISRDHAAVIAHLWRIQRVWEEDQERKNKWREYNKKRSRKEK